MQFADLVISVTPNKEERGKGPFHDDLGEDVKPSLIAPGVIGEIISIKRDCETTGDIGLPFLLHM